MKKILILLMLFLCAGAVSFAKNVKVDKVVHHENFLKIDIQKTILFASIKTIVLKERIQVKQNILKEIAIIKKDLNSNLSNYKMPDKRKQNYNNLNLKKEKDYVTYYNYFPQKE